MPFTKVKSIDVKSIRDAWASRTGRRSLRSRYLGDASGSIAVPFALSLFVMLAVVGVAIDINNQTREKQSLQAVTDIASLQLARKLDANDAELTRIAQTIFEEHLGPRGRDMVTSVNRKGDGVTVVANSFVDTTFTALLGRDRLDVSTQSTSVYSERRMDIVLALDITGSMKGKKLDSLKAATTNMVDTFRGIQGDTVRVGLAPFAAHVNVGLDYRNAPWLDVPPDRVTPQDPCKTSYPNAVKENCRPETRTRINDGVPETYTVEVCDVDRGEPRTVCKDRPPIVETWRGCVGSRATPLDEQADFDGVRIPGLLNKPCTDKILPVTSDMDAVQSSINTFKPRGETYMPSGLLWGWRLLEPSEPIANTDPAPEEDRVLVLMTDGVNTKSKNGIGHFGTDSIAADTKTQTLCSAIKSRNITVYTIAYEVTDGSTRNLLQDCASDPANYFDAKNAAQLAAAFKAIADSVVQLRVAS